MKKMIAVLFTMYTAVSFAQQPLHVMTFNIRYNTESDSLNAWHYRREQW